MIGKMPVFSRSEEHTSELQSLAYLVCRLLLEKKKKILISSTRSNGFTPWYSRRTASNYRLRLVCFPTCRRQCWACAASAVRGWSTRAWSLSSRVSTLQSDHNFGDHTRQLCALAFCHTFLLTISLPISVHILLYVFFFSLRGCQHTLYIFFFF